MMLPDGYDRSKNPKLIEVREMTIPEALSLTWRNEFLFEGRDGKARRARVNGAVKTWKTRPNEFRIPIKYGLRECGYIVQCNGTPIIEGTGKPVLVAV